MRALLLLATLVPLCACASQHVASDSKSNWLRQCTTRSECGSGIDCTCGVCTKVCAGAADCGDPQGAVCAAPSWPSVPSSCQRQLDRTTPTICLRSCLQSSQCGSQQRCSIPLPSQYGVCIGVSAMDAAVSQETLDAAVSGAATRDASRADATLGDASFARSMDAGPASPLDARVQTGLGAATIEVDCRPRYDIVGKFDSHCQYVGADLPEMVCPDLAITDLGGLRLIVRHAERIRVGQPVMLDGNDPDVTTETGFANPQILVQTWGGPMSGTLVFDELRVGAILRGRFVGARLSFLPDPPFDCTIAQASFVADWGPGVIHDP